MPSEITCVRILQRAMQLLGGDVKLAAALQVSPAVLAEWLSGKRRPPTKAYFTALDLVTRHAEEQRRRKRASSGSIA